MSYKLQALTALRDKVKAGDHRVGMWKAVPHELHPHVPEYARQAFLGSLDAAKALHESVLPGWGYEICNGAEVTLRQYSKKIIFKNVCPARAWLLAILDALIAQEGTDHE